MPRKNWSRLTVNLDPLLAAAVKSRARADRRSVAAYLQVLIEADLKQQNVEEEQAAYGEAGAADKLAAEEQARRAQERGSARVPRPSKG